MEIYDTKNFVLALKCALPFVGRSAPLDRLRIEWNVGTLRVLATDGHRLVCVELDDAAPDDDLGAVEIAPRSAKILIAALPTTHGIGVELMGETARFGLVEIAALADEFPPRWREAMGRRPRADPDDWTTIGIDPRYLADAGKACATFLGRRGVIDYVAEVEIGDVTSPIWVSARGDAGAIKIVIMPMRLS